MSRIDEIRHRLAEVDANPVPIDGPADVALRAHAEGDIRWLLGEMDAVNERVKKLQRALISTRQLMKTIIQGDSWVKIADGLPDDDQLVLIHTDANQTIVGRYFDHATDGQWGSAYNIVGNVTHWRELDAP